MAIASPLQNRRRCGGGWEPGDQMYLFETSQHLTASSETLVEFFSDVRQLDGSTPDFFRIELKEGSVGSALFVGQTFRYVFRIFGMPVPWTTEITEVGEGRFVDVQRRGPYRSFAHTHLFFPTSRGTMMIDRVRYSLRFGPLDPLANAMVVRPLLEAIFAFRARAAAERFGSLEDI